MRWEAVLFDLDNTLLTNSMSTFVPKYFSLLSEYATAHFADKQAFLKELMAGTQAMMTREVGRLTNRELFWRLFEENTGRSASDLEPFFDTFYQTRFTELKQACAIRPVAVEFVGYCFDLGLKVVIATNPLFPRRAVEQRLEWAGLPVESFDFALVTTYDNMHAAKPNIGYYEEILDCIGVSASQAVMIGDDWPNDVVPSNQLGLDTFWICQEGEHPPVEEIVGGYGTLEDSYRWFRRTYGAGN